MKNGQIISLKNPGKLNEVELHNGSTLKDFRLQANERNSKIAFAVGSTADGQLQLFTLKQVPKELIIRKMRQMLTELEK